MRNASVTEAPPAKNLSPYYSSNAEQTEGKATTLNKTYTQAQEGLLVPNKQNLNNQSSKLQKNDSPKKEIMDRLRGNSLQQKLAGKISTEEAPKVNIIDIF